MVQIEALVAVFLGVFIGTSFAGIGCAAIGYRVLRDDIRDIKKYLSRIALALEERNDY